MWTYEQATGRMLHDGVLFGQGYSGKGDAKNHPSAEWEHNIGPIPCGFYTMEGPVNSHVHGEYVIPFSPNLTNEMYGRSGFMCHGDSKIEPGTASEGCVIMPYEVRVKMWESGDRLLQVL